MTDRECRDEAQQDAGIDNDEISTCFKTSFKNGKYDPQDDNTLFELEREHWLQYANHFSPSITINNWQYRVRLGADEIGRFQGS